MSPRLTRRGRRFVAKDFIGPRCAGRPSPTECRRALRLARANAARHVSWMRDAKILRSFNQVMRERMTMKSTTETFDDYGFTIVPNGKPRP